MNKSKFIPALVLAAATSMACTFVARDVDTYRADTRTVLETRNAKIKECYDRAIEANETVAGKPTINFIVEKKTGTMMNVQLDESSTAPDDLNQCIVNSMEGLVLDPADQREGQATFTWEFKVGPARAS